MITLAPIAVSFAALWWATRGLDQRNPRIPTGLAILLCMVVYAAANFILFGDPFAFGPVEIER